MAGGCMVHVSHSFLVPVLVPFLLGLSLYFRIILYRTGQAFQAAGRRGAAVRPCLNVSYPFWVPASVSVSESQSLCLRATTHPSWLGAGADRREDHMGRRSIAKKPRSYQG